VTTLFHAAPDLLDEFKQFLPDTSGDQAAPASFANQMVAPRATAKRPMTSLPKRDESGSAKKSKSSSKSKVDDKLSKVSLRVLYLCLRLI
jgi:paired amphipathic helix protein Sin3a